MKVRMLLLSILEYVFQIYVNANAIGIPLLDEFSLERSVVIIVNAVVSLFCCAGL